MEKDVTGILEGPVEYEEYISNKDKNNESIYLNDNTQDVFHVSMRKKNHVLEPKKSTIIKKFVVSSKMN